MGVTVLEKAKKEKPVPRLCLCGKSAVIIRFKGKKSVSCPNPEKCTENLKTLWYSHEEQAIVAWNALIDSCRTTRR